jgi:ankyrin repeat protein
MAKQKDESVKAHLDIWNAIKNNDLTLLKKAIDAKQDLNIFDKNNFSPLHLAVAKGNADIVEALFKARVNYKTFSSQQVTPLMSAFVYYKNSKLGEDRDNREKIINLFLGYMVEDQEYVNHINPVTKDSALTYAIKNGRLDFAEGLVKKGADINQIIDNVSPLTIAVSNGFDEGVKWLFDLKVDIKPYNENQIPLLAPAVKGNHLNIANLLIEKGANTGIKDELGRTAIHYTVQHGQIELLKSLIKLSADLNISDIHGITPLRIAVENNLIEVTKYLLEGGAAIEASNKHGYSLIEDAIEHDYYEIASMLIDNGVRLPAKNLPKLFELFLKMESSLFFDKYLTMLTATDLDNLLFESVRREDIEKVHFLLINGANAKAQIDEHYSVLHEAALHKHEPIITELLSGGASFNDPHELGFKNFYKPYLHLENKMHVIGQSISYEPVYAPSLYDVPYYT